MKFPSLRCFLLRIMCSILGFIVFTESSMNHVKNTKIVISNHVTNFDHLAINIIMHTIVPSVWDLPEYLTWLLGYTDFGASQGRQVLVQNVRDFLKKSEVPVLIFPEGATTNGKKGLLKFNTWPFLLDQAVQPIALRISRPQLFQVAPSVLGSRWWSDMFWFLFLPYTIFTVKYLPKQEKGEDSSDDFCKRVQNIIARELGLQMTKYTSSDKVEYAKNVLQNSLRR
ncbi:lipid droplet-regulating VLDL assembly factor AUP1 homolog isoform X2 [Uloborus diversus]|nr:lipid droplet-regulating VLDL assembly factor AUP1 homolog isoform X2 [Uloborus diversus]